MDFFLLYPSEVGWGCFLSPASRWYMDTPQFQVGHSWCSGMFIAEAFIGSIHINQKLKCHLKDYKYHKDYRLTSQQLPKSSNIIITILTQTSKRRSI